VNMRLAAVHESASGRLSTRLGGRRLKRARNRGGYDTVGAAGSEVICCVEYRGVHAVQSTDAERRCADPGSARPKALPVRRGYHPRCLRSILPALITSRNCFLGTARIAD
jgi:hypothetical protein